MINLIYQFLTKSNIGLLEQSYAINEGELVNRRNWLTTNRMVEMEK